MKFPWTKPKVEKPKQESLCIRYDYGRGCNIYNYRSTPGKNIWQYKQTRHFMKWYFGREQSRSTFITGEAGDMIEWTRKHIINVEINRDYKR